MRSVLDRAGAAGAPSGHTGAMATGVAVGSASKSLRIDAARRYVTKAGNGGGKAKRGKATPSSPARKAREARRNASAKAR